MKYIGLLLFFVIMILAAAVGGRYVSRETDQASQIERLAKVQIALMAQTTRNNNIDRLIRTALVKIPSASRIRIGMIHEDERESIPIVLIDNTNAVAADGYKPGDLQDNVPIGVWKDFLPSMLQHKCVLVNRSAISSAIAAARMQSMNIAVVLACPIYKESNVMIGGSFVSWDDPAIVPTDITATIEEVEKLADLIGRIP